MCFKFASISYYLFNGDEFRRVSSSDSWLTVGNSLVGHSELSEIVSDHFGFNIDLSEPISFVNIDDGLNHGRENDAVSKMSFDGLGLLNSGTVLLGLDQFLDESSVSGVELSLESSSLSGSEHLTKRVKNAIAYAKSSMFNPKSLVISSPL